MTDRTPPTEKDLRVRQVIALESIARSLSKLTEGQPKVRKVDVSETPEGEKFDPFVARYGARQ